MSEEWFRETPESLALLQEARAELAATEAVLTTKPETVDQVTVECRTCLAGLQMVQIDEAWLPEQESLLSFFTKGHAAECLADLETNSLRLAPAIAAPPVPSDTPKEQR